MLILAIIIAVSLVVFILAGIAGVAFMDTSDAISSFSITMHHVSLWIAGISTLLLVVFIIGNSLGVSVTFN